MKYLLLLLIPLTLFSAERKEIRKAKKEQTEIKAYRAKQQSFCASYDSGGYKGTVDKATCEAAANAHVKGRIEGTMGNMTSDYFDKAHKDLEVEIVEEECVAIEQSKLTERGQSFIGTETCTQLEYALCVYDYTKRLVDAAQTPVGSTCSELQAEWSVYQGGQ